MKAVVFSQELAKALSIASRSVASKPQVPVLGNVLLKESRGGLEIVATNLEVGVRLLVTGKVEKGFELTVPARQLTEFAGGLPPGQVTLEISEGKLRITGLGSKAEFSGMSASEFPVVPEVTGTETVKVSREDVLKRFPQVVFAAATDEGRPVLTGVLLERDGEEKMVVVATDGYRLSKVEFGAKFAKKGEFKLLVPARVISELLRLCGEGSEKEVSVWVTSEANQIIFKISEVELVSRLIEGNFPDYKKIIPADSSTLVEFDREEMVRAVKLSAIFAKSGANIVKISVEGEKLLVSANSPMVGENESEVAIKKQGDNLEMAFNYRYLIDFLGNIVGEVVEVGSSGAVSPGTFRDHEDRVFLHIIMPVRVGN